MNRDILLKLYQESVDDCIDFCNNTGINQAWLWEEKFAELLLNECINIVIEQKKWVEDQEVFNPRDEFWNRARIQQSQHIVDKIKTHFGVK